MDETLSFLLGKGFKLLTSKEEKSGKQQLFEKLRLILLRCATSPEVMGKSNREKHKGN